MKIKKIDKSLVLQQGWKPEPHTVSLKDDGEWWACISEDDRLLSVVCVSDKHGGKYFSETFTPIEYRGRGLCRTLLAYLSRRIYKDHYLIAHCLLSSVKCYEYAGFSFYKKRHFKYGDQYFMRREANYGKAEN